MSKEYETEEVYDGLRNQVLTLTQEQLNLNTPVLAVLMETGYEEAVVSLVAIADGASSLYFSNGGGIIGAGEHQKVSDAALELIDVASANIKKLYLTKEFRLPKKDHTRFYIITASGVYTDEALENTLGNNRHDLSPIFYKGHELIHNIQLTQEVANSSKKASKGTK